MAAESHQNTGLDREYCGKLANSISLVTNCDVLITDIKGYVIASNRTNRIGSFHEGSMEVFRTKEPTYHDAKSAGALEGTKPGVTIPFWYEGKIVGSIGITGQPDAIARFTQPAQLLSVMLLELQNGIWESNRDDTDLMRSIIGFEPGGDEEAAREIAMRAYERGVDLNCPRVAVTLRRSQSVENSKEHNNSKQFADWAVAAVRDHFHYKQLFVCPISFHEVVALVPLDAGTDKTVLEPVLRICDDIRRSAVTNRMECNIGVGTPSENPDMLATSYRNAVFVTDMLESKGCQNESADISRFMFERLIYTVSEETCEELLHSFYQEIFRSPKLTEIEETITEWCKSRFNFSKTAEKLYIHKSTLVYRFKKYLEQYGLDMYDFEQVIPLYVIFSKKKMLVKQ